MKSKCTFILTLVFSCVILFSYSISKEQEKDNRVVRKTTNSSQMKADNKREQIATERSTPTPNPDRTSLTVNPLVNQTQNATQTSSMTGEQINWQVLSSGGTEGASTNFMVRGTFGQTAVGFSSSTSFQLNAGFWQNFVFGSGGCCFDIRGNIDNSPNPDVAGVGGVDIADLVFLVAYSFGGGPAPACTEESDLDASGGAIPIDIADIVYLVSFMFGGGPLPLSCT